MVPRTLMLLVVAAAVRGDIVYTVVPGAQAVPPGSAISIDLVVSGLTPGVAPSIGSFETVVTYDPSVVGFIGANFGGFLGTPGVDALTDVQLLSGAVDVAEVSFLPNSSLDANHPAAYSLVTLQFAAQASGVSPMDLTSVTLDDASGLKLQFRTQDGSATVTPEPGYQVPGGIILLALLLWRSRRDSAPSARRA